MTKTLHSILQKVQKPARYVGGEFGEIVKRGAEVRFALCFPDIYEIGMSNLGMQILYKVINDLPYASCERCFAPWVDMAAELRAADMRLFALESGAALGSFDIIGFSLGYEMSYPTMLSMLELAGIEPYADKRGEDAPLIIAGGACIANPEPIAPFADLCVYGDGEDVITELLDLYRAKSGKRDYLCAAAKLDGVYVPSLGNEYKRRAVKDLDSAPFPVQPIVPSMEVTHDRAVIEIARGCGNGCKFCQACFINAPVRSKSADTLVDQAIALLKHTGAQELNLASLSAGDYPELGELAERLLDYCEPRHINLSLPSLRANSFSPELMRRISRTRRGGLTFAPEAGSQRLRDHINKNLSEEDILSACRAAFEGGQSSVKLYFMIGLPTETDEDVLAIADLAFAVVGQWKRFASDKRQAPRITVSVACFVPKPRTPFAGFEQNSVDEFTRKINLLRDKARGNKNIKLNWHNPQVSRVEWILAQSGREIAPAILEVARRAAGPHAWDEFFDYALWERALSDVLQPRLCS
ncbi:MAG: radical SAM protein [Oscillospiraceae bacterium]|jgi:radical SAM superfamily enzyme YgiQ (UPF0313 family)|nr:radical SAM protein [Oscillospiraceae bacterium]